MSPFLFTFIGDALSRSIQFCLEKRILNGLKNGRNDIEISHLQYADDTIILCPANSDFLGRWWDILNLLMAGAGMSLNLAKTSLVGINVDEDFLNQCAANLGCRLEKLPHKLSGISFRRKSSFSLLLGPSNRQVAKEIGYLVWSSPLQRGESYFGPIGPQ